MKVKEQSEKAGLKLNIQNTKIMASGPFTSLQIDGETVETVTGFISLGSKITMDCDCSHEIKRHLLLGRQAMTNLDSVLKIKTTMRYHFTPVRMAAIQKSTSNKCKKNTFESVLMRWMKLEPIIQSEVSQKEKHQYSILTHIYGI